MASKPVLQWKVSPDALLGQPVLALLGLPVHRAGLTKDGHDGSLAGRQVQREKLVGGSASRASGMAAIWGRDFGMRESTADKASRAGRASRTSR